MPRTLRIEYPRAIYPVMEQGDRLVIRYRNPTGGALTARALVQTSAL